MTDSKDGSVMLFDPERGGLFFVSATGEQAASLLDRWGEYSSQRVPLQGSKASHVFTTGQTVVDQSLEEDSEHFKGVDEQTRETSQSMICAALESGGKSPWAIQRPSVSSSRSIVSFIAQAYRPTTINAVLLKKVSSALRRKNARERAYGLAAS